MENAGTSGRRNCPVCGQGRYESSMSVAQIATNVRKQPYRLSTVWRCNNCGSLHSLERRDPGIVYKNYPYGNRSLDGFTRHAFAHYVRRLKKHGITRSHSILDYGCSEGLLVDYLREHGYMECGGYDPFSSNEHYRDPTNLQRQYDVVICQDVIEHVEDPCQLMDTLSQAVNPGGILCIGTPRADGIDLQNPNYTIHSLHQPYHLHILSEEGLKGIGSGKGLLLEKLYLRHSCDTFFPSVNWPFLRAYLRGVDDTLDAGFDPPHVDVVLKSPRLWFLALFGYLLDCESEMIAVFRKPKLFNQT